MIEIFEADDDVEVLEVTPPTMFERNFSEYMAFEDTGLKREELPRPTLWRVLVLPKQPKKMSRGGIALPDQVQDVEKHLNYIGQVIAMGPLAGKNDKFLNPAYPAQSDVRYLWDVKVGDWVLYGRYSGQVAILRGVKLLTLNDDDVTNVISQPDGLSVI